MDGIVGGSGAVLPERRLVGLRLSAFIQRNLPVADFAEVEPNARRVVTVVENEEVRFLGRPHFDTGRTGPKASPHGIIRLLLGHEQDARCGDALGAVEREVFAIDRKVRGKAVRRHEVGVLAPGGVLPVVLAYRAEAVREDLIRVKVPHDVPALRATGVVLPLKALLPGTPDADTAPEFPLGDDGGSWHI